MDPEVPGRAGAVYAAVLRHAALSPILALWRQSDGAACEATRAASADALGVLLQTNAHQSTAALRFLEAADSSQRVAGLGGLVHVGIADTRSPMALVNATGRLAAGLKEAMGCCPSDFPWRRSFGQITVDVYEVSISTRILG